MRSTWRSGENREDKVPSDQSRRNQFAFQRCESAEFVGEKFENCGCPELHRRKYWPELGQRLPLEKARGSAPERGQLVLRPYQQDPRRPEPDYIAQLVRDAHLVIPALDHAKVIRINTKGLVIAGTEIIARKPNYKSACDYYKQFWLCKPVS